MTPKGAAWSHLLSFKFYRTRGNTHATFLADLLLLRDINEQLISKIVGEARTAGYSWNEIGEMLGVSRQAARQKFGP